MKRIAVVMGGYSSESEISLKSGLVVLENLNQTDFEVYGVIITKQSWNVKFQNKLIPIDKSDFSFQINNQKMTFDGAFIVCMAFLAKMENYSGILMTIYSILPQVKKHQKLFR